MEVSSDSSFWMLLYGYVDWWMNWAYWPSWIFCYCIICC